MRLDPYRVILRPLVTEKGTAQRDLPPAKGEKGEAAKPRKRYLFEVAPASTKLQIREAVEEIYKDKKITVEQVNTLRVKGKFRSNVKRGLYAGQGGYAKDRKKAFVTLKQGDELDMP